MNLQASEIPSEPVGGSIPYKGGSWTLFVIFKPCIHGIQMRSRRSQSKTSASSSASAALNLARPQPSSAIMSNGIAVSGSASFQNGASRKSSHKEILAAIWDGKVHVDGSRLPMSPATLRVMMNKIQRGLKLQVGLRGPKG